MCSSVENHPKNIKINQVALKARKDGCGILLFQLISDRKKDNHFND